MPCLPQWHQTKPRERERESCIDRTPITSHHITPPFFSSLTHPPTHLIVQRAGKDHAHKIAGQHGQGHIAGGEAGPFFFLFPLPLLLLLLRPLPTRDFPRDELCEEGGGSCCW